MTAVVSSLILSRFLTRTGDQAFDFALPLALVSLAPQHSALMLACYFVSKLASIVFFPSISAFALQLGRRSAARGGVALQALGVSWVSAIVGLSVPVPLIGSLFGGVFGQGLAGSSAQLGTLLLWFGLMLGIFVASVGSSLVEVLVGYDWIPDLVPKDQLAHVNSRMGQVDLIAEVGSPLVVGLLFSIPFTEIPHFGFFAVALWNLLSFVPENLLLQSVARRAERLEVAGLRQRTEGLHLRTNHLEVSFRSIFHALSRFIHGLRVFSTHPLKAVVFSYALLWLSALSPHGVLLTTYLKNDWQLSETWLAWFRSAGAVFGIVATLCYPVWRRRLGVHRTAKVFLFFQAFCVCAALVFFWIKAFGGVAFLAAVVLSRIGLYGFSLGQSEIRQNEVEPHLRGELNGMANSLNTTASLALLLMGIVFQGAGGFSVVVFLSVFFICLAALNFANFCSRCFSASL